MRSRAVATTIAAAGADRPRPGACDARIREADEPRDSGHIEGAAHDVGQPIISRGTASRTPARIDRHALPLGETGKEVLAHSRVGEDTVQIGALDGHDVADRDVDVGDRPAVARDDAEDGPCPSSAPSVERSRCGPVDLVRRERVGHAGEEPRVVARRGSGLG
jgi:hypothetical protein